MITTSIILKSFWSPDYVAAKSLFTVTKCRPTQALLIKLNRQSCCSTPTCPLLQEPKCPQKKTISCFCMEQVHLKQKHLGNINTKKSILSSFHPGSGRGLGWGIPSLCILNGSCGLLIRVAKLEELIWVCISCLSV